MSGAADWELEYPVITGDSSRGGMFEPREMAAELQMQLYTKNGAAHYEPVWCEMNGHAFNIFLNKSDKIPAVRLDLKEMRMYPAVKGLPGKEINPKSPMFGIVSRYHRMVLENGIMEVPPTSVFFFECVSEQDREQWLTAYYINYEWAQRFSGMFYPRGTARVEYGEGVWRLKVYSDNTVRYLKSSRLHVSAKIDGTVYKKGSKFTSAWKARYAAIKGQCTLEYFEEKGGESLGKLNLADGRVVLVCNDTLIPPTLQSTKEKLSALKGNFGKMAGRTRGSTVLPDTNNPNPANVSRDEKQENLLWFAVLCPGRVWLFKAANVEDLERWMFSLEERCQEFKQTMGSVKSAIAQAEKSYDRDPFPIRYKNHPLGDSCYPQLERAAIPGRPMSGQFVEEGGPGTGGGTMRLNRATTMADEQVAPPRSPRGGGGGMGNKPNERSRATTTSVIEGENLDGYDDELDDLSSGGSKGSISKSTSQSKLPSPRPGGAGGVSPATKRPTPSNSGPEEKSPRGMERTTSASDMSKRGPGAGGPAGGGRGTGRDMGKSPNVPPKPPAKGGSVKDKDDTFGDDDAFDVAGFDESDDGSSSANGKKNPAPSASPVPAQRSPRKLTKGNDLDNSSGSLSPRPKGPSAIPSSNKSGGGVSDRASGANSVDKEEFEELKSQVESLQKQLTAAKDDASKSKLLVKKQERVIEQLKTDLEEARAKALESESGGFAEAELEEVKKQLQNEQKNTVKLEARIKKLVADNEKLEANAGKAKDAEQNETELAELKESLAEAEKKNGELEEQLDDVKRQLKEANKATGELEREKKKRETAEKKVTTLEADVEKLEAEVENLKNAAVTMESDLANAKKSGGDSKLMDAVKKERDVAMKKAEALDVEVKRLRTQAGQSSKRKEFANVSDSNVRELIRTLNDENETLLQQLTSLKNPTPANADISMLQREMQVALKALDAAGDRLRELEKENAALQKKGGGGGGSGNASNAADFARLREEVSRLTADKKELQATVTELRSQIERLLQDKDELVKAFEEMQNGKGDDEEPQEEEEQPQEEEEVEKEPPKKLNAKPVPEPKKNAVKGGNDAKKASPPPAKKPVQQQDDDDPFADTKLHNAEDDDPW